MSEQSTAKVPAEPYFDFRASFRRVANRDVPPRGFLTGLVLWARCAPDELFAKNDRYDIYSSVAGELGPYVGLLQRKAVMLECLRVLAGFESSWNWLEGRDVTNKSSNQPWSEETGIFQVSANATKLAAAGELAFYVTTNIGAGATALGPRASEDEKRIAKSYPFDCIKFISRMKIDHAFAIGFAVRLLRISVKHNGPVLRKEINEWLSREAVAEFQRFLAV